MNVESSISLLAQHNRPELLLIKLPEECAELAAAAARLEYKIRFEDHSEIYIERLRDELFSEIADVAILIDQLRLLPAVYDRLYPHIVEKTLRQLNRMGLKDGND